MDGRVTPLQLQRARYLLHQGMAGNITLADADIECLQTIRAAGEARGSVSQSALRRLRTLMLRLAPRQLPHRQHPEPEGASDDLA